jgi:mono/diheme cytochrome c family protein
MFKTRGKMSLKLWKSRLGILLTTIVIFSFTHNGLAQEDSGDSNSPEATASSDSGASDEAIAQGQSIFSANCKVCHAINERVVGPALKDVHKRRENAWIVSFIKNSQKLIASGDAQAVAIYNEYGKTEMPAFDYLSDGEIQSVISYIKKESEAPTVTANVASGDGSQVSTGDGAGGIPSEYLNAILVGFVVVLVLILLVLVLMINLLNKIVNQKQDLDESEKEYLNQGFNIGSLVKSNGFIFIVTFFLFAIVFKSVIDGLYTVGIQEGYAPKQPIAFSHKLHAGQYEIDCNYCHTGVYISKSANIPSANICMNCHTEIKTESPEIRKIYASLGYDADTKEYSGIEKPIEWVRIHNLPDLSYFNHAQHTTVGGLECETCHGEIKEMEVVRQHSKLTMGWCINCHRTTEVNAKGNAYYDKLLEIHSSNSKAPLKVEDIGGLECGKCHY